MVKLFQVSIMNQGENQVEVSNFLKSIILMKIEVKISPKNVKVIVQIMEYYFEALEVSNDINSLIKKFKMNKSEMFNKLIPIPVKI